MIFLPILKHEYDTGEVKGAGLPTNLIGIGLCNDPIVGNLLLINFLGNLKGTGFELELNGILMADGLRSKVGGVKEVFLLVVSYISGVLLSIPDDFLHYGTTYVAVVTIVTGHGGIHREGWDKSVVGPGRVSPVAEI